ncbi:GH16 domain-containing protein [Mycena chlorophos]|uniref:GH16 domain-containing protein n=1 Tax=Mycena chlorophos TaxID=658473 RepID=A0A8H6T453_MYCCL|nr:GH16 domain-containing protein [Mycena chlorophos]
MRPACLLPVLALAMDGASANMLKRASTLATRHTRRLARDLRIAFGSVLPRETEAQQVIYCKSNPSGADTLSNSTTGTSGSGGASVGKGSSSKGSGTATGSAAGASASSTWFLTQSYSGSNFFDGWSFWDYTVNGADPTHGTVNYLSQSAGQSAGLVQINSAGNAVMKVDTTQTVSGNRDAIRITTQQSFTGGLVILDAVHMPTGCGTWPAFWSNGPNWPTGGEIDIVEGINNYTDNQSTIHTAPGCALTTDNPAQLNATASQVTGGTDCAAATSGNAGCGMASSDDKSFGVGFNDNGGGVYAMLWISSGISVFFWERQSIPSDITAGAPQPKTWGLPAAHWPASDCNPWKYFYTHVVIVNTALCGDWAGSAWTSTGAAGQSQSCATRTGYSTCAAFVQNEGASFAEAYWEITSVKLYNTTGPL